MFDVQEFTHVAHSGMEADVTAFVNHVRSFSTIILWGAGNMGRAIGAALLSRQVPIAAYWDIRYRDINEANGIVVNEPFTGGHDKSCTLIIPCISNGSSGGEWTRGHLASHGYDHVIEGKDIYEALLCPLSLAAKLDAKVCLDAPMCNVCACDRFINILKKELGIPAGDQDGNLCFNVMTFVVNQKCSLRCRYCAQYMNSYKPADRVNFPRARIIDDIDRFLAAVDVVGVVSIIGGEAFLHRDLNSIVRHVLTKSNVGVVTVTTNGVCRIREEQLVDLRHNRVKIYFSDYSGQMSAAQNKLFNDNVALVRSLGINYSVGVPIWMKPGRLDRKPYSRETLQEMKAGCGAIKMCMSVKNGRFFPCSASEPINSLGIGDYPSDYVDMTDNDGPEDLRRKLTEAIQRPYYESCAHCGGVDESLLKASGEQGLDERYCF